MSWYCTISTPCIALHCCHYRHWLNNHDANLVHMPGTHFTIWWMGGPFLPVPKAGLELCSLQINYWLGFKDGNLGIGQNREANLSTNCSYSYFYSLILILILILSTHLLKTSNITNFAICLMKHLVLQFFIITLIMMKYNAIWNTFIQDIANDDCWILLV